MFLPETAFEQIYQTELSMSDLFAYIMNDADYQDLLQNQYREHLILKVPMNLPKIYWDSIWKEQQNCQIGSWDCGISGRKKLAEDAEETYGYDQELDMSPENTTVIQDWKYALHVYLYYRAGSNRCDDLCSKHFCGNR